MPVVSLRLGDIVQTLGGKLHGDPDIEITALAGLEAAQQGQLSFLSHPKYESLLMQSRAACVVVSESMLGVARLRGAAIVTEHPYLYFARLTQLWRTRCRAPGPTGVHASAVIHPEAQLHPTVTIGPLCVIERGAVIGAGTRLASRVTVGEGCVIGGRCIIHSGVVIGADGFGFAPSDVGWEKIEQLGAVHIGDDVEIGANTCIDRGALQDTVIGNGVKLDNLIQIGHNVVIGEHTALAGCVGVAGSATIGAQCTVGGCAVVLGHLNIADHVHVSAASVVTRSIARAGHYTGFFPLDDNVQWEKNAASVKQLHGLRDRIKAIERSMKS